MKILRVRFQNLNSLPSGDVDFESGPLASAGIFAITGPTGAGKSTILDAITLALYGRAARYGTESNPENMMSRHTGECYAEVCFEVRKGRFSARWELRRARKKADGKVQAARRTVTDAAGGTLAEKVNDADRLITELTGLDYTRFLRSVLLAQGEFAQFLKAGKDDRAALLESLTGTQIYSELGILAHVEWTRREDALRNHEGELGRIVLLTEEERGGKSTEIERLTSEITTLSGERDLLVQRIQLGSQLGGLVRTESELGRKRSALIETRESAMPDIGRLQQHRLAQPFVRDLDTLSEMHRSIASSSAAFDNARAAAATTRRQLAAGLQAVAMLGTDLTNAAENALAGQRATAEQIAGTLAEIDAWLTTNVADQALDNAMAGLAEQLLALSTARTRHDGAVAESRKCVAEREAAAKRLTRLQNELDEILKLERATAESVCETGKTLDALLAGRTLGSIAAELKELEKLRNTFLECKGFHDQRIAAERNVAALGESLLQLAAARDLVGAEKARLLREAVGAHERVEFAREKLELMRRIASLEDQRDLLASGQPCPLCGALEHPFATTEKLSGDLREAEQALKTAKAAYEKACKHAEKSAETFARAEQELSGAEKRRGEAAQALSAAADQFARLGKILGIATGEELELRLTECVQARDGLDALIVLIREVEKAKSAAELTHAKQQTGVATTREKIEAEQKGIAAADKRIALNVVAMTDSENAVSATAGMVAEALSPFGLVLPNTGDERQTRDLLENRRRIWRERNEKRQAVNAAQKQISVSIAELDRQAVELRKQLQKLAGTGMGADIANAGPDKREIERLLREWPALDDAEQALNRFRSELAAADAALEECRTGLHDRAAAARRHVDDLTLRLRDVPGVPFEDADSLRAARLGDDEVMRIEALIANHERQSAALNAQSEQVREQCAAVRQAGAPEAEEIAALEAGRKQRDEGLSRATEARTTLRNELAHDEENRRAREAQGKALEEERTRLAVWTRMKELIGSHDGARFRQFAQGLSLDMLVRHANRHLRRLNERYELRRTADGELTLEIVDMHQAGALRPMQSLSGGESFLASLALALGLSDLAGRNVRIDSLFIDEGFGSLDAETLDTAVAALDVLRLGNKTVGVISHVELLKERIPVQIRIEKLACGVSVLRLPGSGE